MAGHMSANQLNYPNESSLETYRHSSRVPSAPSAHERSYTLSQSRSNLRADPLRASASRGNSGQHGASSAASNPRRRITVACIRCRKRKIRCSGDSGDSGGCTNCKSASVMPGSCVFLRVQCEMRELIPDHVLMMGYEQVSSAQIDLHHHPYSTSSSASSSASSLAMVGVPHHNTAPSQNYNMNAHALRIGHNGQNHHMHNTAMPLRSLCHQDQLGGNGNGGDSAAGLLLSGRYDGLGSDMTGGTIHGSTNNVMSVSNGDMYNGTYAPQYLHPDIGQGMASNLHGQQWASMTGGRNSSLYLDQDQPSMHSYIAPNQSIGTFNVVFPALSSLSSSLPDGVSLRASGSEKVQLPLPIRTQASEPIASNPANLRPSSTGNSLMNDPVSSSYERQSLQASYRVFPGNSWTGDASFSSASQSAGMAIPSTATGIPSQPTPALHVPCQISTYGAHNPPTFPLSSSNSSLLPSSSHQGPLISGSSVDSFPQALTHQQNQKNRSNSESSNSSKAITPATTMRTNSTPSYTRSSVGGFHKSNDQFGEGYTNLV